MKKIIARLKREPILSRVGLAAILNVLVVAGVIDTGAADGLEQGIAGLVGIGLALSARQKVTPVDVIDVVDDAVLDAQQIANAVVAAVDQYGRRHAAK